MAASMTTSASAPRASRVAASRSRPSASAAPVAGGIAPLQASGDRVRGPLDGQRIHVVQDDLVAGREDDLGDAGTHRPGADDADDGHTGFIASNGCRQSRQ